MLIRPLFLCVGFVIATTAVYGQRQQREVPDTMGLDKGTTEISTPDFALTLGNETGVATKLDPKSDKAFDFLPSDWLERRRGDGFVHLGDLKMRVRPVGSADWASFSSYAKRSAVKSILKSKGDVAAFDITGTMGDDCPVSVTRHWRVIGGHLQLVFDLKNTGSTSLEIGGLGLAMPFNNIIMGRSLEQAHATCSFTDPFIGGDAGYLRVTRLDGVGPTMVVTPVGKTPLEAWQLIEEPIRPNQVFEGMMSWDVHTKADAETDWKGVTEWVPPSSAVLKPGETRVYGVQFTPSPSIRKIESTLAKIGRPVTVALPGTILPIDQTGKLFFKYYSPVKSYSTYPKGALSMKANSEGKNGFKGYSVTGKGWGRVRLTVNYQDGTTEVVSYYLTKPATDAVSDLGHFLTTKAWFTDKDDPFGRTNSAISYDREADAQVKQDSRVWIAGLGDEGGSGNWLALAMKEFGRPNAAEITKLDTFVSHVIWGNLQFADGPKKYGVRKSVFYYDPAKLPDFPYNKDFNWTSWTSWDFKTTNDIGRGYNYPHVVAAYWAMYRIARNHPGLKLEHPWSWYLDQAYETTKYLTSKNEQGGDVVGYWRLGLMDGSVFTLLLTDLKREGWTEKADLITARMKERADRWAHEPFPFGSEMAWDSTGQEEVYMWCKWFGFEDKAQVTLNSILAYDPTVPHWGYNGNARRYWDFLYGGKLSRIERQLHHYGSGLNAIPLLNEYRQHPDDFYLLRVGYGGTMGSMSSIDQGGFASAAFHSFPSTLKWDAYSGDYGPNFFGHAFDAGTYVVKTPDFGWQAMGGSLTVKGSTVTVKPQDSFRKRVYLASLGLFLTLDAGRFSSVSFDTRTGVVTATLEAGTVATPSARLVVESPAVGARAYKVVGTYKAEAGAVTVPLKGGTTVTLRPGR